jgi:hypothetical protein
MIEENVCSSHIVKIFSTLGRRNIQGPMFFVEKTTVSAAYLNMLKNHQPPDTH